MRSGVEIFASGAASGGVGAFGRLSTRSVDRPREVPWDGRHRGAIFVGALGLVVGAVAFS